MRTSWKVWLVVMATATLLSACGNPPTAKVTEAQNLIATVEAAGGEQFAPEKLASIKKNYADALAEIKEQDGVMFKNYSTAEFALNQVMDDCDELRAKMAEAKGEPKVTVNLRNKFAGE